MREFRVTLPHRPGELAQLTRLISRKNLSLKSVSGISNDNAATICIVCENVAGLRQALQDSGIQFQEAELLTRLMEDEPGKIADLCESLSECGADLQSIYILARDNPLIEIGFTVNDPKKAKKALDL